MTTAEVGTDDGVMGARADRPKRRRFTAEYKAAILAGYGAAEHGVRGTVLRREGLYSSHIIEWRKAAQAVAAAGLEPAANNRRGRERDREIAQLRARAEKAEVDLSMHNGASDLMGNAHALGDALREPVPPVTARRSKR